MKSFDPPAFRAPKPPWDKGFTLNFEAKSLPALLISLPESKIAPVVSAQLFQKGLFNISPRAVGCLLLVSTLNRGINS